METCETGDFSYEMIGLLVILNVSIYYVTQFCMLSYMLMWMVYIKKEILIHTDYVSI